MTPVELRAHTHFAVSLPANLPACMGGWCHIRESCQRYGAQTGFDPIERLCEPGLDGVVDGYPVRIHRLVGSWERPLLPSMLRPADFLTPADAVPA